MPYSSHHSLAEQTPPNYEEELKRGEHAQAAAADGVIPGVQYDEDGVVAPAGATKIEAANKLMSKRARWALFISLGLACYVYSLDGVTTWQYLQYATSTELQHSLAGTIVTASSIIIAVGKPLMAKLADVFGRAETYVLVTILYTLGYILIASAPNIGQIAGGNIIYSFGYTGLQLMTQIVLADITTLRWRGFASGLVSMPFIINTGIAAEIALGILPNWRWGYGMFAIIVPACLFPIILVLFWSQHKAKKLALVSETITIRRGFVAATCQVFSEMDFIGLVLVAAALGLILLPLGLAPKALHQWKTPSMIVMIVIGCILIPVVVLWEAKFARHPIMPYRFFKNPIIAGACLIGFLDFVSFYLQYTFQYSFVYVVKSEWNARELSWFSSTQTIALCVFGLLAGIIMAATRRYKWMLVGGLCIRLLGVGLMIHARGALGPTVELVFCQVLQGIGGGFAAIAVQVAAQASVSHVDVATVTAMVLLITEIGNSVGSAIATAVWTSQMPGEIAKHVPGNNATLNAELFGSTMLVAALPADDPVRIGVITAYEVVMKNLCIGATVVAIFPIFAAIFLMKDFKLTDTQNAHDGKTLDGAPTGEGEIDMTPVVKEPLSSKHLV